jgi:hypothetical protein
VKALSCNCVVLGKDNVKWEKNIKTVDNGRFYQQKTHVFTEEEIDINIIDIT